MSDRCSSTRDAVVHLSYRLSEAVSKLMRESYIPQDIAEECLGEFRSLGFGNPGTSNTLWGMVMMAAREIRMMRKKIRGEEEWGRTADMLARQIVDDLFRSGLDASLHQHIVEKTIFEWFNTVKITA